VLELVNDGIELGEAPTAPIDAPARRIQQGACLALELALGARAADGDTPSGVVGSLVAAVGSRLGLDAGAAADLQMAARLRDVGMLALPDSVVRHEGPLSAEEWELISRHPVLGARILEQHPALAGACEAVRFHHERWDGEGYPDGLRRAEIPLSSRVISVCDAFVALATDRPHRRGIGPEGALEQVMDGRDSQFDPDVVDALLATLEELSAPRDTGNGVARPAPDGDLATPPASRVAGRRFPAQKRLARGLAGVVEELDVIPALAPAHDRLLAVTEAASATAGEIATAVEDDVGLTIAVLRRVHPPGSKETIVTIPEAVSALGAAGVRAAVADLPLLEFSWRGSPWETVLQRFRAHAIAVGRAAMKLAGQTPRPDDVLVPALLHDVGKLALFRARTDYPREIMGDARTPEARVIREQRALGVDHPTLGALLLRRWGLPDRLARAVAGHHEAETAGDAAWVRLADMLVHHAQGEPVDRNRMLSLSYACDLHPQALRNVLFELPHAGGSKRRRSEPSPLSARETEILRCLASAKRYADISEELGISMSTVRSHLHSAYSKLEVDDRAQAVLRATEQGWI
jgi:putative nucleotidyltransferase with HDIG domain